MSEHCEQAWLNQQILMAQSRLTYWPKNIVADKNSRQLQSNKPNIIFLAGPSASGKSTVTKALKAILTDTATLKTDHFLKSYIELKK